MHDKTNFLIAGIGLEHGIRAPSVYDIILTEHAKSYFWTMDLVHVFGHCLDDSLQPYHKKITIAVK